MTNETPIIAKPEDLDYETARRSYSNTSQSPERRAQSDQQSYADDVNGLYADMLQLATTEHQQALLAAQMERYRQGYLEKYTAYLHSHSRVASSFITGPANFPVRQQQKRGQWAENKRDEFLAWRNRARAAIKEAILDARTPEEKDAAEWRAIRRDIEGSLNMIEAIDQGNSPFTRSSFANSIAGKVERLAQAGDAPMVERSLELLREYDKTHKKAAFTARHKVWTFDALAREAAARNEARAGKPHELLTEANGIELWADYRLDRVQLVFPDKPDHQTREGLKRSGWKWSPTNEAWQRQLTQAGIASGKAILAGLMPEREGEPPAR